MSPFLERLVYAFLDNTELQTHMQKSLLTWAVKGYLWKSFQLNLPICFFFEVTQAMLDLFTTELHRNEFGEAGTQFTLC